MPVDLPLNAVVIVAAGRGQRMGGSLEDGGPKQYRDLAGRSVLARAAQPFLDHPEISVVVVAIHPDDRELYRAHMAFHEKLLDPVPGGATRQASVLAGLEALAGLKPDKVLIHDAARAFVTAGTVSTVLATTAPGVAALPAHGVVDTLKRADEAMNVTGTLARDGVFAAQTPQGFVFAEILKAHRDAASAGIEALTDDCSAFERAGMTVRVVPSPAGNIKITTREDLDMARARLGLPDIRTGNGYDVHRLAPGDHLWLCGVRIEHDRQLLGHSDADVGLHALTDALLATVAQGDIGSHFPPSDPQWKGASSDRFLAHAARLVREAGGRISHLDATLICEEPKVGPHRDAMRARIAEIVGIDMSRISVKATTNEGIGFIGRGEGISAIATATAVFASSGDW